MLKCSCVYMFTYLVDHMLTCLLPLMMFICLLALMLGSNALIITCFYVHVLRKSFAHMCTCLDDRMLPCLPTLTMMPMCPHAHMLLYLCACILPFTCWYSLMLKF